MKKKNSIWRKIFFLFLQKREKKGPGGEEGEGTKLNTKAFCTWHLNPTEMDVLRMLADEGMAAPPKVMAVLKAEMERGGVFWRYLLRLRCW